MPRRPTRPDLTPEQRAEADRILAALRQAAESDLRGLAELLAANPVVQRIAVRDSTFFRFRDKVAAVAAYFNSDGLTLEEYLHAAVIHADRNTDHQRTLR